MENQTILLNGTKFGNIEVSDLTDKQKEIALIQGEQLEEWREKLVDPLFFDLKNWLNSKNLTLTFNWGRSFDPFEITRGIDMTGFINCWSSKPKPAKSYID